MSYGRKRAMPFWDIFVVAFGSTMDGENLTMPSFDDYEHFTKQWIVAAGEGKIVESILNLVLSFFASLDGMETENVFNHLDGDKVIAKISDCIDGLIA